MAPEGEMDRERAVDRFWDQVVQGRDSEVAGRDLSPDEVAAIRRFYAADDRPEPSPAFARQLLEDLIQTTATTRLSAPPHRPAANGHSGPVVLVPLATPKGARERPPWIPSLATAALVLLTLIGSYVAFGGPLRQRLDVRSAHIPAITPEVTPTATPAPYELQGVVKAVAPGSSQTRIARAFLQPGAEVALFSGKSGDSALSSTFVVVESGQLEITAGGPITVARAAGNATTPVAAGTDVTLESGDSAVITAGVAISLRNPGPDPVSAINADVAPVGSGQSQEGYRVEILAELYDAPIRAAATMRLRQATLAPGETLPLPTHGVVQLAAADTNIGFMLHTNDGYRNIGSSPIDAYVLTIEPQV